ncbi:2,3-diphosphoglycerate-dependent phosphoglycerate mutase [Mycobacterium sp. NPDC048908]|uniref:2,3-bisphosphoglycerate-dependent phosphoglycerate mutase n=1 Tax=Mycobacterium sp. NPDC048908 TaxID=3364292 RepID=UPI0037124B68
MSRVLVLLRHGESTANAADVFGGWLDFPLTNRGRDQAAMAGALIRDAGISPGAVHTSLLTRAIDTADTVVAELGSALPVRRSWRLNERHYGALQGRRRSDVRKEFGVQIYADWRRSYHLAPPALPPDHPQHPRRDARYAALPARELPTTESLAAVRRRLVPYWQDAIAADLSAGHTTLVVAHGNSLRALCMHLDGLTPQQVSSLHIPTGVPLRYDLDDSLMPLVAYGVYLDPVRAAAGIAEVAAQGTR